MEEYLLSATKEFTWDMAHMLCGHQGLCKNLHGHTYKMEVTVCLKNGLVQEGRGPAEGMVVDFKEVSTIVKSLIVEPLDHATMIYYGTTDEFEKELGALLSKYEKKCYLVDYRPTAENMAIMFLHQINKALVEQEKPYLAVKIRLYETPTSYAEVIS